MIKSWMVGLAAAGCLFLVVGCEHEHAEGNEVKLAFAEVPAAVRETLMREAPGAMIKTVDMEEEHGKTIYEADAMLNGQNWEIKVDPSGKLISKKIDKEEDEEKDGKGRK